MKEILKSASKITLLVVVIVASVAYLYSVIAGIITIGDTFDKLVMLVAGFYFAYKGKPGEDNAGK